MRPSLRLLPALLFTVGCYSEVRYDADYDQAFCDKVFECSDAMAVELLPYASAEDCLTYREALHEQDRARLEASGEDNCAFDAGAAADCVDATTAMACPAYNTSSFPAVCDDVCGLRG